MRKIRFKYAVLIAWGLIMLVQGQTLAKVNFSSIISEGPYITYSSIGISYDFNTLIPYLNSTLLLGYLKNAKIYNNDNLLFYQTIHMPLGYKYGCASTLFGGSAVNCTLDISTNSTLVNNMNVFFEVTQYMGVNLGWDMEKSNFTRNAYKNNFANYYFGFWGNDVNVELVDRGDLMTNYTATSLNADIPRVYPLTNGFILAPGLT